MIYLDRNENNYGPAPACIEVLRNADTAVLSWYDRSYTEGIRGVLSARLAADFGVPEERIIVDYGAESILKQTIRCTLSPGATLAVPAYSWWYYKKIASEVGAKSVEYPMIVGEDRFIYDLDGMREVYRRERPAVVFISSPNNPTGNSIDLADLHYVLDDFRPSVVVVDEAYVQHARTDYLRRLVGEFPNLLIVRTFSKYYALAGLRIGFGILGGGLTSVANHLNRYLGYNRLSEEIALAALDSPTYYRSIAGKMQRDKEACYAELGAIPGWRVFRSDANFVLARIPAGSAEALERHLKEHQILIKFMSEPLLKDHVRITLGTEEQNRLVINSIKAFFAR
jgi:histidinol-phosphate aminotransferase